MTEVAEVAEVAEVTAVAEVAAVTRVTQDSDTFAQVVEQLRAVLDEDAAWSAGVTAATTLDGDLELESIELTALSRALQARHGAAVDLAAYVAELDVDQIIALTVGEVAAFVSGHTEQAAQAVQTEQAAQTVQAVHTAQADGA